MNVLNIALLQLKISIRDKRTIIFMLAFPIVMMLVLGSALSNAFDNQVKIDKMKVLYKETHNTSIAPYFEQFMKAAKKENIHFYKASDITDGKKAVRQNHYDAYVEVSNKGMNFYGSERNSIESSIIQGMLTAFADKYNLVSQVAKVKPNQTQAVLAGGTSHDYVKEMSLNAKKAPGSMDYYAVAVTTMIALYGAIGATFLLRGERTRNTAVRLAVAPITKAEIFIGKIIGSIVLNLLSLFLIVAVSSFLFKANWGDHLGFVFIILLSEVFLAVSFGLGVSYMVKTGEAARTLILIILQLASFFGGAYFKIEGADGMMKFIMNLSPITWANTAITKNIYNNDFTASLQVIGLNLGIAIVFLSIAIVSFKRREGF
ncbi:ABC-2 type transport system permease protein [Fictibacillus solisalsi]|uniref:ABC-2 type transport system permease protein n=1 Tax=Fictibacillus solisalsi TaxID=459525 RepID=A0A1G9XPJ8_9BACL|nr:ABC transporter permease [Fictibacillus solisalsi]SDM98694.1 ABC-2 type transport system permease protein [Fictibacillus solisalsi]